MGKQPCVYLLASGRRGTLYIGVTSDLLKRVWLHRSDIVQGFSKRYHVHNLVWFEMHATMPAAIARESALKCWKRSWKLDLVEQNNPEWLDLYDDLTCKFNRSLQHRG